jgi:transposase
MGKSITDLSSVTTVGLDLAKHVFQVHGVDASGRVIVVRLRSSTSGRSLLPLITRLRCVGLGDATCGTSSMIGGTLSPAHSENKPLSLQ